MQHSSSNWNSTRRPVSSSQANAKRVAYLKVGEGVAPVWIASRNTRRPETIHFDVKRPYPANLCPLSCRVEFAGFGKNLGQPIGELIEAMSRRAVRERATEHLDSVLGEE